MDYIRYGGILGYSKQVVIDNRGYKEYIDSAIIDNIENSLADSCENYTRSYYWDKISGAIDDKTLHTYVYTLVNSISKKQALRSLLNGFRDHNLRSAMSLIKNDINNKGYIEYIENLRAKQCELIDMAGANKSELIDTLSELIVALIKIDVITENKIIPKPNNNSTLVDILYTQPGLRYAQVVDLINQLLDEYQNKFIGNNINITTLKQKIIEDLEGRLLEDTVIINFIQKYSDIYDIFKFSSSDMNKEVDIVIYNKKTSELALFEVKRSDKIVENQYRWLVDQGINDYLDPRYGHITARYVLYTGKNTDIQTDKYKIYYRNISSFLLNSSRE